MIFPANCKTRDRTEANLSHVPSYSWSKIGLLNKLATSWVRVIRCPEHH